MRRKRKGDEFTRERAAKEICEADADGERAGRNTTLNSGSAWLNPHDDVWGTGWTYQLHRAWDGGFNRGQRQRRAEIENAFHELTESEEA